jgi:nicotinamide-nucleotide amidase
VTETVGLARLVLDAARTRGVSIAVAESLTGGLVCAQLTAVPGASLVFRGGVVAYATEVKSTVLDVDPHLLDVSGPVSSEVALAMASGVRARLGSNLGIATTGVAGPDPQDGKAPGTAFVAVVGGAAGDLGEVRALRLSGDRSAVRNGAGEAALELALEVLTRR